MRPITEVETGTLLVLSSMLGTIPGVDDVLSWPNSARRCRAIARVVQDGAPESVERVSALFDREFCAWVVEETVSHVSSELRLARARGDLHDVARLLWAAARRHGAAWRRLESRARDDLIVLAVKRAVLASVGSQTEPSTA